MLRLPTVPLPLSLRLPRGQQKEQVDSQAEASPAIQELLRQSLNHMHNSRRYPESQPIPNNGDAVVSIYKNTE